MSGSSPPTIPPAGRTEEASPRRSHKAGEGSQSRVASPHVLLLQQKGRSEPLHTRPVVSLEQDSGGRASPAGAPLSPVGGVSCEPCGRGLLHAAHRCIPTPAISPGQHRAGVQGRGPQRPLGIGCFSGPPASGGNCTPPPPAALAADSPPRGQGVPLTGTCTPSPSPRTSSLVSGPSFCAVSSGKVGALLAASAWTRIPASAHCVPRPEPRACPCWASPPNAPQRGCSLWYMHASRGAWDGQGGAPPQGHHLPEEVPSLSPGPSAPSSGSWCCGCSTNRKASPGPLRSGHVCPHAHTHTQARAHCKH